MEAPLLEEWVIGPDLGIDSIELDETDTESEAAAGSPADEVANDDERSHPKLIPVESGTSPHPHIKLPVIGCVTGMVRLFDEKISGGKSDERGASNGFHVNVLGRVVNQHDPSFGEENLNHAAWARFRMAVRADGLNEYLTTNREQFREHREMKIFESPETGVGRGERPWSIRSEPRTPAFAASPALRGPRTASSRADCWMRVRREASRRRPGRHRPGRAARPITAL